MTNLKNIFTAAISAFLLTSVESSYATTLDISANVDNQFNVYVSTSDSVLGALVGSGTDWTTTYSFSDTLTPNVTQYIHVVAINQGGPGGFLGMFSLSDSNFSFLNNTQLLLTATNYWQQNLSGFGNSYSSAVDEGANGVGPWGTRSGYATNSPDWIWNYNSTGSSDFNTVYFSTAILSNTQQNNSVPEPTSIALLASGILGFAASRRKATQA